MIVNPPIQININIFKKCNKLANKNIKFLKIDGKIHDINRLVTCRETGAIRVLISELFAIYHLI